MTEVAVHPRPITVAGMPVALLDPVSGEFVLPSMGPEIVREYIALVAQTMLDLPGEKAVFETKHTFLDGMYVRELTIPKGTLLVGKVHKIPCVNLVTKGDISVMTETGSARVTAGFSVVSPAGIQKLGYAHEDTIFVNVFRTDETDLTKIDQAIAWDDGQTLIEGVSP